MAAALTSVWAVACDEDSADLFFGREAVIHELISRVKDLALGVCHRSVGERVKSSLVRAGLIYNLKHTALPDSDRWLYEALKPGWRSVGRSWRVASSLAGNLNAGDDIRTKGADRSNDLVAMVEIALKDKRSPRRDPRRSI
ncbi:MAG: hypothetical protein U0559_09265 [Anaerolineae bacterium]